MHLATEIICESSNQQVTPSRKVPATPPATLLGKKKQGSLGGTHLEKPCLNLISRKSTNQETRTLIATNLPSSSRYVTSALAPTCSLPSTVVFLSIWKVIDRCADS